MAFELALAKSSGATFPTSYRRVDYLSIDRRGRTTEIRIGAYVDKASADAAMDPEMVDSRTITGADFDAWFSDAALATAKVTPMAQAYVYAATLATYQKAKNV